MADPYLLIDHDRFGLKVFLMAEANGNKVIQSRCELLFKDLPEPLDPSDLQETDLFDAAMDRVADSMDLSSCSTAVVLVSQEAVYFRTICLPFRSEKKLQQVLPFELEPLLPASNDPFIFDFHILDQTGEMTMILTASIAESRIETYFSKLGHWGIRPKVITPAGYAGAVAFLKHNLHFFDIAYFYITEGLISLTLVHDRKPWTVRTLPGSFSSAEMLAAALHQTITGFRQKTGENIEFNPIITFGRDTTAKDDFLKKFEKAVGRQVQVVEDIDGLTMAAEDDAGHRINFCKGKYKAESFLKTHFHSLAAAIVLFFCTIGLWMVGTSLDNDELYAKIRFLDEKALSIFTATFPDQKRIQDPYLQMKANVKEILKKTNADPDKNQTIEKKVRVMDALAELSERTDPSIDVEISSFLLNEGRIVLSGSTDNFNAVDKIKTGLESSEVFKKVGISSAAADKKGDRVNFKFNIDL
jgi:general secretion pathway protein L